MFKDDTFLEIHIYVEMFNLKTDFFFLAENTLVLLYLFPFSVIILIQFQLSVYACTKQNLWTQCKLDEKANNNSL